MSLFQCENCGCCENTALSMQGFDGFRTTYYDWSYAPERKGMKLCSACGPIQYKDGTTVSKGGRWHNKFERVFLPKGQFFTNKAGNLEHRETGSEDFHQYRIEP